MGWLSANWIWVLLIGVMLLMHLRHGRMHGGHGSHASHGGDAHESGYEDRAATSTGSDGTKTGHRHGGC